MADENITSADTQEGAQQQSTDAQLLDDLTSLQQATEGMDEAQADGQVATNNEGDADNPSMTRPDDEFKDQRGLPEGGTTDTFALDNTDLENSNEQSTTTDTQFTAQNTTNDSTAINLDNVRIDLEGAEGREGSSGTTSGSSSPAAAAIPPADAPTTPADPAPTPSPTLAAPATNPSPTTPQPTTDPTVETPPSGSDTSPASKNSGGGTPNVSASKLATPKGSGEDDVITTAGDEILFTINVSNDGDVALSNIDITDSMFKTSNQVKDIIVKYSGVTLRLNGDYVIDGVTGVLTINSMDVGAGDITITYSYIVSQDDIDTRDRIDNLMNVGADGDDYSSDDPAEKGTTTTTILKTPDLELTKSAVVTDIGSDFGANRSTVQASNNGTPDNLSDDITYQEGSVDSAGDLIAYTLTAKNAGNETLTNVKVFDAMFNVANDQFDDNDLLTTADAGRQVGLTVYNANGSVAAALTYVTVESITTNNVTSYFVNVPNLLVGQYAKIDYVYTVQQSDIDSDLVDGSDLVVDIDNVATASSLEDEYTSIDPKERATYDINVFKTPDLELTKSAVVTDIGSDFGANRSTVQASNNGTPDNLSDDITYQEGSVDSAGDLIAYTLTAKNAGNETLTNVKVFDAMFNVANDQFDDNDLLTTADAGRQVGLTVYNANGSVAAALTYVTVESITTNNVTSYFVNVPNLLVGQYAKIDYVYTVQQSDIDSDLVDGSDLVVDIDNVATASSLEDEYTSIDPKERATYDINVFKTPDLELTKSAVVTDIGSDFGANRSTVQASNNGTPDNLSDDITYQEGSVDSAGDLIAYTLTAKNAGNETLTNVKVFDAMFNVANDQFDDNDLLTTADAGRQVGLTVYNANGSVAAALTYVTVESITTNNVTSYFVNVPNLLVGQYAKIDYVYTVQQSDIDSDLVDGSDLVVDIDNVATASSLEDEYTSIDPKERATYDINVFKTPDLELTKSAVVTDIGSDFGANRSTVQASNNGTPDNLSDDITYQEGSVDSAGDLIAYTLTAKNAGNETLTNVKVFDAMFNVANDQFDDNDLLTTADAGRQVGLTVYNANGSVAAALTYVTVESITTNNVTSYFVNVPNLLVGQYAKIDYVYTVQQSDIDSDLVDGSDLVVDIDNVATASSLEDEYTSIDPKERATYDINVFKTPDLELTKSAVVTDIGSDFGANRSTVQASNNGTPDNLSDDITYQEGSVDSAGDLIAYTLTAKNAGNETLTNVKVFDAMFNVANDQFDDNDLLTTADAGRQVGLTVYNANGSVAAALTYVTVESITTNNVTSYFVNVPNLLVGQYAKIDYVYTVQPSDIDSKGGGDFDIDNAATADSQETNLVNASYAVNIDSFSDVAITKFANVSSAEGIGSKVSYQLTISNQGTTRLTNVRVDDTLLDKAVDVEVGGELQVRVDYYVQGQVSPIYYEYLTVNISNLGGFVTVDDLEIGSYAVISYDYIVSESDFDLPSEVTRSIYDYISSSRGPIGHQVDFSYGHFEAYVNQDGSDPYGIGGNDAQVYVNVDNTGKAIGVNAGVMSGDRNGNSDHLKATFYGATDLNQGKSLVQGASIVFTNAKDVELAFKLDTYAANKSASFIGSIFITERGEVSLHEVINGQSQIVNKVALGVLSGSSNPTPINSVYTFSTTEANSHFGQDWTFTLTEEAGPGGAQNKLYTLVVNAGNDYVKSFDFWVAGNLDDNAVEQIKVVDIEFDVKDFGSAEILNIATVSSSQDNSSVGTDHSSDEISQALVTILADISVEDAKISLALGEKADFTIKDDATKIIAALNDQNIGKKFSGKMKDVTLTDSGDTSQLLSEIQALKASKSPLLNSIILDKSNLAAGEATAVTFNFSEAVKDFTSSDVTVENGTLGTLSSSIDGKTWTGTFTASSTLLTADNQNVMKVLDGSFTDIYGNRGIATPPSGNYSISAETTPPNLNSITLDDSTLLAGQSTTVTFEFSEAVKDFVNTDVTVENGTLGTLSSSLDGKTWTGTFTASSTLSVSDATNVMRVDNNSFTDIAGNNGIGKSSDNYTVARDSTAPTLNSITLDDSTLLAGQSTTVTFEFSEAVKDFVNTDVTVENGTLGTLSSSLDGKTWTGTFTASSTLSVSDATNVMRVDNNSFTDIAGNNGIGKSSDNYTVARDSTAPTLNSITLDDSTLLAGQSTTVTFEFSEAVKDFVNTDVTVENGTLGTLSSSLDGKTWTGTFTASSTLSVSDATNVMRVDNNSFTDIAGNNGIGKSSDNYTVARDSIAPTATATIVPKTQGANAIINVTSSEIGIAYIVRTTALPVNISTSAIETLDGSFWNSVTIEEANTNYQINYTSGLSLTGSGTNFTLLVFDNAENYVPVNNGNLSTFNITQGGVVTPITLDLNNDGIEYLSTSAGVTYDYDGDGIAESTAWVSPEDGLLALSQEDGSLKIVFSTQDGETDLQGLAKIYDSNQDGQLDELDTFFNQFGVWQDADSDGVVDSGEFQSLTNRDIVSLDLVSDGIERTEANGDVFVYGQTTYTKADGTTGLADDAAFVVKSSDQATTKTIQIGNSGEVVHVPDFGADDQIDLSTILANAAITRDNLKDYVQLVDGENGTVLNIDTTGHGGEGGWVQVASLDNVHVSQTGVNMFFDPTNQTIDFTQSSPDEWKVEDGDTPV